MSSDFTFIMSLSLFPSFYFHILLLVLLDFSILLLFFFLTCSPPVLLLFFLTAAKAGNRLSPVLSRHRCHRLSAVWLQHRSHQCSGAGWWWLVGKVRVCLLPRSRSLSFSRFEQLVFVKVKISEMKQPSWCVMFNTKTKQKGREKWCWTSWDLIWTLCSFKLDYLSTNTEGEAFQTYPNIKFIRSLREWCIDFVINLAAESKSIEAKLVLLFSSP